MTDGPRPSCRAGSRRWYLGRTEAVVWHAGATRLDTPPDVFRACEDSMLQLALCAVCRCVIGQAPFTVHTLMGPGPSPEAPQLIPAVTVPIHATCPVPPPAVLSTWMIDAFNAMLD